MYPPGFTTSNVLSVLLMETAVLLTVTAQKNLTPFGEATVSSTANSDSLAKNAIDGPISNAFSMKLCTHTNVYKTDTPAWWMFEFSFESAYITEIQIYYRENLAERLNGFKLYVTNSSNIPPEGYLCYADPYPSPLPKIIQSIPCHNLGKYVIYYDTTGTTPYGPIIELCYVAINGCQKRLWGKDCEKTCAGNCIEQHCFPGNGSCVWGCNTQNCLNDICNENTAVCTAGCKERRTGIFCDKYNMASNGFVSQVPTGSIPASLANDGNKTSCPKTKGPYVKFQVDLKAESIVTGVYITFGGCPPTNYGPFCNTPCPENCRGPCDLDVGHCTYGCMIGWSGNICNQECSAGTFGTDCSEQCSANCLNANCSHVTGECVDGCQDGWQGFNCSQTCPHSKFGSNCLQFCEGCLSRMCNHVSGLCDNTTSCNPGYKYSPYCNIACDDGNFGNKCEKKCNCLSEPCSKEDGICPLGGCKKGWIGESCNKECSSGYFGQNCEEFCEGCIYYMCEKIDGLCKNTTGCGPGYLYKDYCNKTCDVGYFGNNCTRICNCLTGTCNKLTGTCSDGFQIGSEQTSNVAAISGSVAAFIIVVLIIVAVFIFYKRRLIGSQDTGKTTSSDTTIYGTNSSMMT